MLYYFESAVTGHPMTPASLLSLAKTQSQLPRLSTFFQHMSKRRSNKIESNPRSRVSSIMRVVGGAAGSRTESDEGRGLPPSLWGEPEAPTDTLASHKQLGHIYPRIPVLTIKGLILIAGRRPWHLVPRNPPTADAAQGQ